MALLTWYHIYCLSGSVAIYQGGSAPGPPTSVGTIFRTSSFRRSCCEPFYCAAMARMQLQNRFSYLAAPSPRDDADVPMPDQARVPTTSWDELPASLDQALKQLKSSYQRRHHLDAPLGFDETGELWQWFDHHSSQTCKAAPQYSCQVSNGAMRVGQVDLAKLLAKLAQFAEKWQPLSTVWLYVDNRSLEKAEQPSYWAYFSPWIQERCRWLGPYGRIYS